MLKANISKHLAICEKNNLRVEIINYALCTERHFDLLPILEGNVTAF